MVRLSHCTVRAWLVKLHDVELVRVTVSQCITVPSRDFGAIYKLFSVRTYLVTYEYKCYGASILELSRLLDYNSGASTRYHIIVRNIWK